MADAEARKVAIKKAGEQVRAGGVFARAHEGSKVAPKEREGYRLRDQEHVATITQPSRVLVGRAPEGDLWAAYMLGGTTLFQGKTREEAVCKLLEVLSPGSSSLTPTHTAIT